MELTYAHLVSALLIGLTISGPVNLNLFKDDKTCAKRCIAVKTVDYEVGNAYRYIYSATSKTLIAGASENTAFVKIDTDVEIETTSPCDFVMRLKNTKLSDSEEKSAKHSLQIKFGDTLQEHPLRFSFQGGRIEDLCPNHDEPTWSLNIKRGILSSLQSAMEGFVNNQTFTETDVNGDCETQYSAVHTSRDYTIRKTKDLTKCKHRQKYDTTIQSIGYALDSGIQSLPILKSRYECQQKINKRKRHLLESVCTETNLFRPFSSGENGASNVNMQSLKFAGITPSSNTPINIINYRTDLIYEHEDGETKEDLMTEILNHLRTICQEMQDDVRPGTPSNFYKLVKLMRQVDISALNSLYTMAENKKICEKNYRKLTELFMDAIPMLGTVASVDFMTSKILNGAVSYNREILWIASFPFIPNPKKTMLEIMRPLIDGTSVWDNTILAVSSVVNSYCQDNPRCADDNAVKEIISVIEKIIGDCKWKEEKPQQFRPRQSPRGPPSRAILYALKALGNIGRSESIGRTLTRCFTISTNPVDVRLAAIDAFRRVPCGASRMDLEYLFDDVSEDSEIRINAYLALMKCPTERLLTKIHESLRSEKSNQVKSFILSHLKNLKTTSDPHFQNIRAILEDHDLGTDSSGSDMDVRKYSRNYEGSMFFDSIGAGAKIDSNVIFSSKSFVPRSGNVNLTLDIFGQAVNLLELGGRIEGLEYFLESYFGPSGHLKSKSGSDSNSRFPIPGIDDKYKPTIDKLQGSAYFRLFGNELGYWRMNDAPSTSWLKDININKLMQQFVKESQTSFSKSAMLLDMKMVVPTCVGLPLNLSFAATSSVKLEAMGKIEMPSFKNIEIVGSLSPSAAIDVTGEMSVDAFASKAGVRMTTVAHTNTAAKVTFSMKDRQIVMSSLELPKNKMEVINVKSDFFIVHRKTEEKQKMIQKNSMNKSKCTSAAFGKITGLEVCMQVQYSNASTEKQSPFFPLTGPMVLKLDVSNKDLPKGYRMEAKLIQAQKFGFHIDTPDSKTNRKISAEVDIGQTDAHIEIDSPWRKLTFTGKSGAMPDFQLSGEFQMDYKNQKIDKYGASLTMLKTRAKQVVKWTPKFEIYTPSKQWVAEGKIEKIQDKKLNVDLSALGFFNQNVSLKFSAERVKKNYRSFISLRLNEKRYSADTNFAATPKGRGTIYSGRVGIMLPSREPIKLSSQVTYNPGVKMGFVFGVENVFTSKVQASALAIFNKKKMENILKFNLKSPKLTLKGKGNVQLKSAYFGAHLECNYVLYKHKDKVTFDAKLRDESNPDAMRYRANLSFTSQMSPKRNVLIIGKFNRNSKRIETAMDIHLGKKNPEILQTQVIVNHDFASKEKTLNYYMKIKDEKRDLDFELDLDHNHQDNFLLNNIASTMKIMYASSKSIKLNFKHNVQREGDAKKYGGIGGMKGCKTVLEVTHLKQKMTISNQLKKEHLRNYENTLSVNWFDGKEVNFETKYMQNDGGVISIKNSLLLPNRKQIKLDCSVAFAETRYKLGGAFMAEAGAISKDQHSYAFDGDISLKHESVDASFLVGWAPSKEVKVKINRSLFKTSGSTSAVATLELFLPWKGFEHITYSCTVTYMRDSFAMKYETKFKDFYSLATWKWYYNTLNAEYTETRDMKGEKISAHYKLVNNKKMFKFLAELKAKQVNFRLKTSLEKETVKNFQFDFMYNANNFRMQSDIRAVHDPRNFNFFSNGTAQLTVGNKDIFNSMYSVVKKSDKTIIKGNFDMKMQKEHHKGKTEFVLTRVKDNIDGKFSVHYNDKLIVSLSQLYKHKQDDVFLKTEMALFTGEVLTITTDVKLSRRKTLHSEILLRRVDKSVANITIESSLKFEASKSLDAKLQITTNHQYLNNFFTHLVYRKKKDVDKITSKMNIFGTKINTVASLEGSDWFKKSMSVKVNRNGFDVVSISGNYEFDPVGDLMIRVKGSTKQISELDQFGFSLQHLISSRALSKSKEKNHLQIEAFAKVDGEKYEFITKGKYFTNLLVTVSTPTPSHSFSLNMEHDYKNKIDIEMKLIYNDVPYVITFQKAELRFDMKFTASLPPFKEFKVNFSGGMGKNKKGDFKFRASYSKHFIQTDISVSFRNFLEMSLVSSFDILSVTGSGEVKLTHYLDQLFTQFSVNLKYDVKEINFEIMAKREVFIIKLNTPYDFNISVEINDMSIESTDLKLIVKTPWSNKRTVKYFHKKVNDNNSLLGLNVKNANNVPEFTIDISTALQPMYKADVVVTRENKSKKYIFKVRLDPDMPERIGSLHVELPEEVMPGKVFDANFKQVSSSFSASFVYHRMEYEIELKSLKDKYLAKIKCNWDKDDKISKFVADIQFLNKYNMKKLEVTINHPARSFGFSVEMKTSREMAQILTNIHWDIEKDKKITFAIGGIRREVYLKIFYPQRILKFVVGFDDTKTTRPFMVAFLWDADRDDNKKLMLTIHTMKHDGSFSSDVAINLMPAKKIIQWTNDVTWGRTDKLFYVKSIINIDHDPKKSAEMAFGLMRENTRYGGGYRLFVSANRPLLKYGVNLELRALSPANLGIEFSYVSARGDERTFALNGNYNPMAREFNITMRSPLKNVWWIFNTRMDKDYEFSFVKREGDQSTMESYMIISPSRKSMKMKIDYDKQDPAKSYLIDANVMSDKLFIVKASQAKTDRTDVDMRFRLNNEILHSNIKWRPDMTDYLMNFLMINFQQSMKQMKMFTMQAEMMIKGELMQLVGVTAAVAKPDINRIGSYLKGEMSKVMQDTHETNNELYEMYNRNYLNVKYAVTVTLRSMERMGQRVNYYVARASMWARGQLNQFEKDLGLWFNTAVHNVLNVYPTTVALFAGKVTKQTMMAMQQWYEEWSKWHFETFKKFDSLSVQEILDQIRYNRYFHIVELISEGDWPRLSYFLFQQSESYMQGLAHTIRFGIDTFHSANFALRRSIAYLSKQPLTQDIIELCNEIHEKALWAWRYWGFDQSADIIHAKVKSYLMARSAELKRQIFHMDQMNVLMLDLHRGRIEFDISLTLPKLVINTTRHVIQAWNTISQFVTVIDEWVVQCLASMASLYTSASNSDFSDLIPPFKATASLFNDQHYITFDGQYNKFKGECSYVLTRDFVDNNFTVIVNYQNEDDWNSKIDSILFYNGDQKIEILNSYTVRYNSRPVNLPLRLSDATILRLGPVIKVTSEKGLELEYNPLQGFLIVEISGWYFGKVAGLFGTYNNEYYDELTPSNTRPGRVNNVAPNEDDMAQLAYSWATPGCRSRENLADPDIGDESMSDCADLFNSTSSPFSGCFDWVEPQNYYQMCVTRQSTDGDICSSAQFYTRQCARQGIYLTIPDYCVSCQESTGYWPTEDEVILTTTTTEDGRSVWDSKNSADIIFVVEERKCNQKTANAIKDLAESLDDIFYKSGMKHIRYGLVGFGGKNMPEQYARTLGSELLFSASSFSNILPEIKYDGFAGSDPMAAVQFATKYPFRSGLRKTIVLLSCTPSVEKTATYYEAFEELKKLDIALHLLQDYTFRNTQNRNTKTILYGVDRNQAFARKEVEEELFDSIQIPKDYYGQLALASNGSLFDARVLAKQTEQRSFVSRFAQRIADSVEVDPCLQCQCTITDMGVAQPQCPRCSHVSDPSYFVSAVFFFFVFAQILCLLLLLLCGVVVLKSSWF
ncbi:apolipophorins-like [Octopus vulgaris]|uniref:Apolipophorins-like n=1 Tax=Octopus vulgaris TaxID=6645 RepID=A0AA36FLA8_OCTVU|nr:apolipophorins-like [Octopus vulgaris]